MAIDPNCPSTRWSLDALFEHFNRVLAEHQRAVELVGTFTDKRLDELSRKVNELTDRANVLDGRTTGISALWVYVMGAASLVLAMIGTATGLYAILHGARP